MAEYGREQRNQLSRAIANSETGNRQLKEFCDNSVMSSENLKTKEVIQSLKDGTNPIQDTSEGLLNTMSDKRVDAKYWNQNSLSKNFAFDENDTANYAHSQDNRHSEPKVMAIAGAKGGARNLCLVTERYPCTNCYQDIVDFETALGQEIPVKYFVAHDDNAPLNLYGLYSKYWEVPGRMY